MIRHPFSLCTHTSSELCLSALWPLSLVPLSPIPFNLHWKHSQTSQTPFFSLDFFWFQSSSTLFSEDFKVWKLTVLNHKLWWQNGEKYEKLQSSLEKLCSSEYWSKTVLKRWGLNRYIKKVSVSAVFCECVRGLLFTGATVDYHVFFLQWGWGAVGSIPASSCYMPVWPWTKHLP